MGGPQATYFTQAYARFEFAEALVIVAGAVVVNPEPDVWFNTFCPVVNADDTPPVAIENPVRFTTVPAAIMIDT